MTPIGLAIEALKIDKLEKRWVARCLFLLVYCVNAFILFWEPGDSDFSALMRWAEKYSDAANYAATEMIELPYISIGNIIFILSLIGLLIFNVLMSNLYLRIYIGDRAGQKIRTSVGSYFQRLPILIIFLFLLSIVLLFVQFLILPALFAAAVFFQFVPAMILYEKKGLVQAIKNSVLRTKGIRFFIILSVATLNLLYSFSNYLISSFLWDYKQAAILLDSLIVTVLCLSFGRMSGIIYSNIFMKSKTNENENNSIENS